MCLIRSIQMLKKKSMGGTATKENAKDMDLKEFRARTRDTMDTALKNFEINMKNSKRISLQYNLPVTKKAGCYESETETESESDEEDEYEREKEQNAKQDLLHLERAGGGRGRGTGGTKQKVGASSIPLKKIKIKMPTATTAAPASSVGGKKTLATIARERKIIAIARERKKILQAHHKLS